MGFLILLTGVFGLFTPQTDTTFTDTLHVFNAVDSVYSSKAITVSYDQSQPLLSTGHFIPEDRTEKILPSISDVPEEDNLFFSAFTSIAAGEEKMYPLSAVVKLFQVRNDTATSSCSGIMVSPRHVLTAGHCVYRNNELRSPLYAFAGYHQNGIENTVLLSRATTYYTTYDVRKQSWSQNDIALLELDYNIGDQSGWMGLGYFSKSDWMQNQLTYTYGYPATTHPVDTTLVYDGEAMIEGHGFGRLDSNRPEKILLSTVGTPGQSGSSLFVKDAEHGYFSLGTFSFTSHGINLSAFQKITAFNYLAFSHVIENADPVSIAEEIELARDFRLHQNYPNPFNPTTVIPFELKKAGEVSLSVYTITGQKVATLLSNERFTAGYHTTPFNAENIGSGMYLYVLQGDGFRATEKMILLK
ncbi:trypsin-like serine peptidase [Gracilimonas mengyeensis]|uniref:Por secretion system C-terminal sorting domain-containing protein n=1 Tax=Gracilimonas mengyeensis TaxID=1302730 RepID=A0A521BFE5_9BACT|nr:trypsin-like serine protease [Gracilimonas mengyeensis]SMO45828.1 Por secretion system C-terminal sorting domain-containing protein [Gracilimonas mengyeensis]